MSGNFLTCVAEMTSGYNCRSLTLRCGWHPWNPDLTLVYATSRRACLWADRSSSGLSPPSMAQAQQDATRERHGTMDAAAYAAGGKGGPPPLHPRPWACAPWN